MEKPSKPHYDTNRLNEIPFSSVVDQLDVLKRKGVRNVTTCPWHDDKHPSLTLYEGTNENRCHCFACGKGGSVIDYVMQHKGCDFLGACQWLANTFGVGETEGKKRGYVAYKKPKPEVKKPAPTYIPYSMVEDMASSSNSLCKCMRMLFDPGLVNFIAEEYMLGIYDAWGRDDCVAFPNIDRWGRVHNIKAQHYCTDMASEHFCHSDQGYLWLGTCFTEKGLFPKGSKFSQICLFGEHLLSKYPTATVALTESPKNALFGAAAMPELVWVATGNKNSFEAENVKALQGRDVYIFPDHDAYKEWEEKAKRFEYVANFRMVETTKKVSLLGPKYDIADILLDWRLNMPL